MYNLSHSYPKESPGYQEGQAEAGGGGPAEATAQDASWLAGHGTSQKNIKTDDTNNGCKFDRWRMWKQLALRMLPMA